MLHRRHLVRSLPSSRMSVSFYTQVPASFPRPMEDRGKLVGRETKVQTEFLDDFFCVDPASLSNDQLNDYKSEMHRREFRLSNESVRLLCLVIDVEKTNLERIQTDSSARLHACRKWSQIACVNSFRTDRQGIVLAEESTSRSMEWRLTQSQLNGSSVHF